MSWRAIIGNLLMKAGDSLPAPAKQVFTYPLNYVLASLLQGNRRSPAALLAAVQQEFPGVAPADCAAIHQQLEAAYTLAADLAGAVNRQQMSQDETSQRLQQAFPHLAQANLARLLLQNLVGTRAPGESKPVGGKLLRPHCKLPASQEARLNLRWPGQPLAAGPRRTGAAC